MKVGKMHHEIEIICYQNTEVFYSYRDFERLSACGHP